LGRRVPTGGGPTHSDWERGKGWAADTSARKVQVESGRRRCGPGSWVRPIKENKKGLEIHLAFFDNTKKEGKLGKWLEASENMKKKFRRYIESFGATFMVITWVGSQRILN
jgi:hypothetical protein